MTRVHALPVASISTRRRIAPGKLQEQENFVKTEILPIYRKAKTEGKIAGFSYARRSLGAAGNEVTSTIYLNRFADLDAGPTLIRMLGQDAAAKLAAKGAGLSTAIETVVRRRVADLSF